MFFLCKKHIHVLYFSINYLKYVKAALIRNGLVNDNLASRLVFFIHSSIISFIFAYISPFFYIWMKRKWWKLEDNNKVKYLILKKFAKNGIESELINSIIKLGALYMLSMSDRKVYVGTVSSISEPDEVHGVAEEFSLIPVYSGYRDKDTLVVNFTTSYKDFSNTSDPNIFVIHMKKENIVSMTLFDVDTFSKFKEKEKSQQLELFSN